MTHVLGDEVLADMLGPAGPFKTKRKTRYRFIWKVGRWCQHASTVFQRPREPASDQGEEDLRPTSIIRGRAKEQGCTGGEGPLGD